jgi:hypothetical protein
MLTNKIKVYQSYKLDSMEIGIVFYNLEFVNEENKNFQIRAFNNKSSFSCYFSISDYLNIKERDFIEKVNNFELLCKELGNALKYKKARLCKMSDTLIFAVHYSIIYENKFIVFELHPENDGKQKIKGLYYKNAERIIDNFNEKNENYSHEYKAEIIKNSQVFEDCGDRYKMKVTLENKGTAPWPKKITSLKCVPRLSSVLCEDYIFADDIQPGSKIEVKLEFLKVLQKNLKAPYLTCLQLSVLPNKYEPFLVIDMRNPFSNDKIIGQENAKIDKDEKEKSENKNNNMPKKIIANNRKIEEEEKNKDDFGVKKSNNQRQTLTQEIVKPTNNQRQTLANPTNSQKLSFAQRIAMFDSNKK